MEEPDGLVALRELHRDLVALSETRLPTMERLEAKLRAGTEEFKKLLNRQHKNDQSRRALQNDQYFQIGDLQCEINDAAKNEILQIADELDLDERETARSYWFAQKAEPALDRPPAETCIIRFHQRRETLLECLQLSARQAVGEDVDDGVRSYFVEYIHDILGLGVNNKEVVAAGSTYWLKCLSTMRDIEDWLRKLADRVQGASIIGLAQTGQALEILRIQRNSLTKQHESLGAILTYIAKLESTTSGDFRSLLQRTASLERFDLITVHYVPVLMTQVTHFGSSESTTSIADVRGLDQVLADGRDSQPWKLRNLHAAVTVWWLAEYSGRYSDANHLSPIPGVDFVLEAEKRRTRFSEALRDGALQFMLTIAQFIQPEQWYDPAKVGLMRFLLNDAPEMIAEPRCTSLHFHQLTMRELQVFADALITNMPDTLRKMKAEEDDQRRHLHRPLHHGTLDHDVDLERFLLIVAHAFAGNPDAAQDFWGFPDGNLFGFLQWAAKRQSTPRAAAFCELLHSISENEECADATHAFLLDERTAASGKLRKGSSISWNQIFDELGYYADRVTDKPSISQSSVYQTGTHVSGLVIEPESSIMLECYLRLTSHLCKHSNSIRRWLRDNPAFPIQEKLWLLARNTMDSRLRAYAFKMLAALLIDKDVSAGNSLWNQLDQWISSKANSASSPGQPTPTAVAPHSSAQASFEVIASEFDESLAFVELLQALAAPGSAVTALQGALPFEESLGTTYRMPGIDPYVDFVLGRVFARSTRETQIVEEVRLLRFTCLNFIVTCLTTFNEDLVLFANKTNMNVDSAIECSSLASYVRLHPFARTMEWLFNDSVIKALFLAATQSIEDVSASASNSPLVLSLLRSVEVIDHVLRLQSTYLDIVRPIVKLQATSHKTIVANAALATFEDAVLGNVQFVLQLGLYCDAGHHNLSMTSLRLLQRLASSRKLAIPLSTGFGDRRAANRLVEMFEQDGTSQRVAAALTADLSFDSVEWEIDPPALDKKTAILHFLNGALQASPDRPGFAHALLGFCCNNNRLEVPSEGPFASGFSLFHAVYSLVLNIMELPGADSAYKSSLIKELCLAVLTKLLSSPLTGSLVIEELQNNLFLPMFAVRNQRVDSTVLWEDKSIYDPEFLLGDSALTFRDFLLQRAVYFEYAASELRMAAHAASPAARETVVSTVLGLIVEADDRQYECPSVLDLFDFVEMDVGPSYELPKTQFFKDLDLSVCAQRDSQLGLLYDLRLVQELLQLKKNEVIKSEQFMSFPANQQRLQAEEEAMMLYLLGRNQHTMIVDAHARALNSWTQLLILLLTIPDFQAALKISFALQALQVVLPKMDRAYSDSSAATGPLTRLVQALMQHSELDAAVSRLSKDGDFANDRLSQAFRVSLKGINSRVPDSGTREACCQICYQYVQSIANTSSKRSGLRQQTINTLEAAGDRLVAVVCDDALAGEGTCKVSALLLLEGFVTLYQGRGLKWLLDLFAKFNFISVLLDGIKNVAAAVQVSTKEDIPSIIGSFNASQTLLLRLAQTKIGAGAIVEASLFDAVRSSYLFSTDPDIGLDVNDPSVLTTFYSLLLSVLRVITSVTLTRGVQNKQAVAQAREFLQENRVCVLAIFKRSAGIGGMELDDEGKKVLEGLVENLVVLATVTGFMDHEESTVLRKSSTGFFT
ncbi:hypothetical protein LTR66_004692 [Elasticomyces elasticus]|nr:hypothetical protein LTR66_004692 [Elasticomyces elasticus]